MKFVLAIALGIAMGVPAYATVGGINTARQDVGGEDEDGAGFLHAFVLADTFIQNNYPWTLQGDPGTTVTAPPPAPTTSTTTSTGKTTTAPLSPPTKP